MKMTSLIALVCAALGSVTHALASVDAPTNRALLEAMKSDKKTSTKDKLYRDRCWKIQTFITLPQTPSGRATGYSCSEKGVGIAIYAGVDLGGHSPESIGQYFISKLAEEGIKSNLFIKHNHDHGTHMAFFIDGQSWLPDPIRPTDAIKRIKSLIEEAKLTFVARSIVEKLRNKSKAGEL